MLQAMPSRAWNETREMAREEAVRTKKVTAFVGIARRKHTYNAVREFLDRLEALGGVETEMVSLGDYRIERCTGCKTCFLKGEEFCPLKHDDRDLLIGKMAASDGVILASPNYSFMVSALMKTFLERLGFIFHRPRFFGKAFTSIVVQGIYGGGKIVKYLDFVGKGLGFNVVKGSCTTALEPMTTSEKEKRDKVLARQAERFHRRLLGPAFPKPGLLDLLLFRMGRTSIRLMLDGTYRDYRYYAEKGWFKSDFYYPIRLGPLGKSAGRLFDWIGTRLARNRNNEEGS